jgi:hypothetical protein
MITVVSSSFPPSKSIPRSCALYEKGELKVSFWPLLIAYYAKSFGSSKMASSP